jgi:hypothetical protein
MSDATDTAKGSPFHPTSLIGSVDVTPLRSQNRAAPVIVHPFSFLDAQPPVATMAMIFP